MLFGEVGFAFLDVHYETDQALGLSYAFVLDVDLAFFAIVAGLVAGLGVEVGFAQVVELKLPAAGGFVLAVFYHLGELLCGELFSLKGGEIVLEIHGLEGLLIGVTVEENTLRKEAVSARSAALLVVVLKAFGEGVMYDESDIWFVDAHSKGDCGHDNMNLIVHPLFLCIFFILFREISVIVSCFVSSFV